MSKYTPGPWRVAKVVDSKFPTPHVVYVLIDDGRKRNVCAVSVYGRDEQGKPTKTRQEQGERRAAPSISDDECKANARLIAAAPELLEALRDVMRWVGKLTDWEGVGDPDIETWRKVITKAEVGEVINND